MIEITAEREKKYVEMDIDMTDETEEMLIAYAKEHILDDKPALINYAFIEIIKKQLELEKEETNNDSQVDS